MDRFRDTVSVVTNRDRTIQVHAHAAQHPRDVTGIGIYNFAEQDLGSYGYDFCGRHNKALGGVPAAVPWGCYAKDGGWSLVDLVYHGYLRFDYAWTPSGVLSSLRSARVTLRNPLPFQVLFHARFEVQVVQRLRPVQRCRLT